MDCESAPLDAADVGNNEENRRDNGRLSVTCARGVTHTIARDGQTPWYTIWGMITHFAQFTAYMQMDTEANQTFTKFQSWLCLLVWPILKIWSFWKKGLIVLVTRDSL